MLTFTSVIKMQFLVKLIIESKHVLGKMSLFVCFFVFVFVSFSAEKGKK